METATKALLRQAAIQALQDQEDVAAGELLALLSSKPKDSPLLPKQQMLLPGNEVIDGPARDYHFWVQFIRENFIPFLTENGRARFTSNEMFTWLENCRLLRLTTGDLHAHQDGTPAWRCRAGKGLSELKKQGIVSGQPGGREFQIRCQQLQMNQPAELTHG
jgi:hypothetical protein